MRRILTTGLELVALTLVVAVALFAFGVIEFGPDPAATPSTASSAPATQATEENEGLGPAEPDEWFLMQRAGGPGRTLNEAHVLRAVKQAQALRAAAESSSAPRQIRGRWEHQGPTNIGGRIVDLVVDPDTLGTLYVAAASGGVWKSTDADRADGRLSLEKAWPDDLPQATGAIAMGSDGRIWAGTGETQPGGGSITFGGSGIYVSDDGGETWKKRGLENSHTTGRILVDPSNPRRIFVAASGSLFNPGEERGIYRSDNGGASWKQVLAPETPFAGGVDLALHPSNPNRIYAALWDHRREPDVRTYGGLGSGLYRSDDGGDTWERLSNVLTYSDGDSVEGVPLGLSRSIYLGRIGVAIAPSNPDRVYVITTKTDGTDGGFYYSDDGGDSFNASGPLAGHRPGSQGGFGWWFGRIWVDPLDEDHVFVAGVSLRRSVSGGRDIPAGSSSAWVSVGGLHADQHAMQWDPHTPGRVYEGNDGGTYRSDANGASGFLKAVNEPYTQFYSLDVGELAPDRITGGTQDNGCIRSWSGQNPGSSDWFGFPGGGCGDGEYTLIDPTNPNIFYGCSQYASPCVRRYDGPAPAPVTNASILRGNSVSTRWNWTSPLVFDPNDPTIMYFGGNVLNKSTNRGTTWTRISPPEVDLTGSFEPGRYTANINGPYPNWGTLTTIDVAKTAPNTIYVGSDTGRLWKTEDGGATWTWFNEHGLPDRWVTRVAIDPTDEQTVWATFSGYRAGEDAAHVYKTTDGGQTWTNASGNLPSAPVNDVVVDTVRDTVYVGTDVGLFYLKNGKASWKPIGTGVPLAAVMDIRLHQPSASLFAATFGRGIWKIALPEVVEN